MQRHCIPIGIVAFCLHAVVHLVTAPAVAEPVAVTAVVAPQTDADGVPGTWYVGATGFLAAMEAAKAQGRPVMIYVYTDWCPYCRWFNNTTLPHKDVQACLEHFVKVRINPDDSPANNRLAEELGVRGYPSLWAGPPGKRLEPWRTDVKPAQFAAQCRAAIGARSW